MKIWGKSRGTAGAKTKREMRFVQQMAREEQGGRVQGTGRKSQDEERGGQGPAGVVKCVDFLLIAKDSGGF